MYRAEENNLPPHIDRALIEQIETRKVTATMREFEVWSEGYVATGNESGATFHGYQEARTFQEACERFFKDDAYYNKDSNTYWGCRLYNNEADARRYFG